ncbi:LuxR C-terminal-related transcriptional regulator [Cupriavidus sp. 2MCAB6]|uniref:response regulator transcription factor n=1 Tax=Cupriavidus sp. 2MCAB6 TaxID=3232981 RepID=UPI003F91D373
MNALLIEEHPLLSLGLFQMLENIHGTGHVVNLSPTDIAHLDGSHRNADLMVFGMPADTVSGWQQLDRVRELIAPKRILVLADALPLWVPSADSARNICGCLPKSASLPVIEAAIRMAASGSHGLLLATEPGVGAAPAASRSALPATASLASAAPLPLAVAVQADPHAVAACAATPRSALRSALASAQSLSSRTDDAEPSYDEAEMLKITPRQYEVLVLLARGHPIKTVSRMLNISVATVKSHACTLYQRLKVRNKGEAVYAALQRGATLDWVSGDERVTTMASASARRTEAHSAGSAAL